MIFRILCMINNIKNIEKSCFFFLFFFYFNGIVINPLKINRALKYLYIYKEKYCAKFPKFNDVQNIGTDNSQATRIYDLVVSMCTIKFYCMNVPPLIYIYIIIMFSFRLESWIWFAFHSFEECVHVKISISFKNSKLWHIPIKEHLNKLLSCVSHPNTCDNWFFFCCFTFFIFYLI